MSLTTYHMHRDARPRRRATLLDVEQRPVSVLPGLLLVWSAALFTCSLVIGFVLGIVIAA